MLFNYKVIDNTGVTKQGQIDTLNKDLAISSLQQRGFVVVSVESAEKKVFGEFSFFKKVSNKDIVILSRQIATLFDAQVSVLRIFRLLASESENLVLRKKMTAIADDLQGGSAISQALGKHQDVFSVFYINMVKAGEESGKLKETFLYLADYLDKSYDLTSKAKNALVYPAFVVVVFITVMTLMFTMVIPKISSVLVEAGQEIPFFTKIVMNISDFLVGYGFLLLIAFIVGAFFLGRFIKTPSGRISFSKFKITMPYIGSLFRKLYLARIAGNLHTMLLSGVPIVNAIESTAGVVDNAIFQEILEKAGRDVRTGKALSLALSESGEIPGIMIQMIKIGEETGEIGMILETMAKFYEREVDNTVNTLVGLIEPVMIVLLALGVGILLTSILIPIYNISSGV